MAIEESGEHWEKDPAAREQAVRALLKEMIFEGIVTERHIGWYMLYSGKFPRSLAIIAPLKFRNEAQYKKIQRTLHERFPDIRNIGATEIKADFFHAAHMGLLERERGGRQPIMPLKKCIGEYVEKLKEWLGGGGK